MLDSLEIAVRTEQIHDSGPFYNEFVAHELIKEPWNAISSLLFFVPIIFWLIKLRGEYKTHLIIVALLPLLFLNGMGSTLYHAFRSSQFFFFLDVLPAAIMSFSLAWYFWNKVFHQILKSLITVLLFYAVGWGMRLIIQEVESIGDWGPNVSYLFVGAAFLVPLLIDLKKRKYFQWKLIVSTILLLVHSLAFRALDYPTVNYFEDWLPQGTHFLWHIFSVATVFTLGYYLYLSKLQEVSKED